MRWWTRAFQFRPGPRKLHGITEADVTGQPSLSTARFISNKPLCSLATMSSSTTSL